MTSELLREPQDKLEESFAVSHVDREYQKPLSDLLNDFQTLFALKIHN